MCIIDTDQASAPLLISTSHLIDLMRPPRELLKALDHKNEGVQFVTGVLLLDRLRVFAHLVKLFNLPYRHQAVKSRRGPAVYLIDANKLREAFTICGDEPFIQMMSAEIVDDTVQMHTYLDVLLKVRLNVLLYCMDLSVLLVHHLYRCEC